jgi:hypothetical protein
MRGQRETFVPVIQVPSPLSVLFPVVPCSYVAQELADIMTKSYDCSWKCQRKLWTGFVYLLAQNSGEVVISFSTHCQELM